MKKTLGEIVQGCHRRLPEACKTTVRLTFPAVSTCVSGKHPSSFPVFKSSLQSGCRLCVHFDAQHRVQSGCENVLQTECGTRTKTAWAPSFIRSAPSTRGTTRTHWRAICTTACVTTGPATRTSTVSCCAGSDQRAQMGTWPHRDAG